VIFSQSRQENSHGLDHLPPARRRFQRPPDAVMSEDLRQIAATTAKDVKVAGVGIALQQHLNLKRQTLHAPAHVRVTHRDAPINLPEIGPSARHFGKNEYFQSR
jgi:hypothetical protein